MATFVREHDPSDFQAILTELERKALPNNFDRTQAGFGRSQAFGVIRRWSYRPWLSRNCWMRPELWQILLDFAALRLPDGFTWDAVQVNDNYSSQPHTDKGNRGESYIVGFGDYTGGDLIVEGTHFDIRHRGYLFNGAERQHWTDVWQGHRYSLVFFSIEWPTKFLPGYTVTSRLVADGLEVSDTYDDAIMVLDRKGHIVRWIRQGQPRPWIGRLTEKGQRSRAHQTAEPSPGT